MHTNFRNSLSQYSRRLLSILAQINHNKKTTNICLHLRIDLSFCWGDAQLTSIYKTQKYEEQKKNAEHTHMYTNFRNFLSQYSRRLLSILAQQR